MLEAIPFIKMHSLENKILIIPRKEQGNPQTIREMCHENDGLDADQVMVLSSPITIWNKDGSSVEACGNGTRCIISYLNPPPHLRITLQGPVGPLLGWQDNQGQITVCQGKATSQPLLCLKEYGLEEGMPVYVGNPHLILFQKSPYDVTEIGPRLGRHPNFPLGVNLSFVETEIRIPKVVLWERGAGATKGSGSCGSAVAYALWQRGEKRNPLTLQMPGGLLKVKKDDQGTLYHTALVLPLSWGWWFPCQKKKKLFNGSLEDFKKSLQPIP